MEAKNLNLLNQLRQNHFKTAQIDEKDQSGQFVFYAKHDIYACPCDTYTCEEKIFPIDEFDKQVAEFKKYIDEHGVDDKLLHDLDEGYENVKYPIQMYYYVANYICDNHLNNPEYIIKFLDIDHIFDRRLLWFLVNGIIKTNNAEYIKLFMEKFPFYKSLQEAYEQAAKSNKRTKLWKKQKLNY